MPIAMLMASRMVSVWVMFSSRKDHRPPTPTPSPLKQGTSAGHQKLSQQQPPEGKQGGGGRERVRAPPGGSSAALPATGRDAH